MGMSNYTRQALLNSLFGKISNFGALAAAPAIHVALSSTQPNPDGSNVTEPTTGAYARVATLAAAWNLASAADPAVLDNAAVITFPVPTADWLGGVPLGFIALYDAAVLGNFLDWGTVSIPRSVVNGDPAPSIPAGQISIEIADE